jgi:hypothetical protein
MARALLQDGGSPHRVGGRVSNMANIIIDVYWINDFIHKQKDKTFAKIMYFHVA